MVRIARLGVFPGLNVAMVLGHAHSKEEMGDFRETKSVEEHPKRHRRVFSREEGVLETDEGHPRRRRAEALVSTDWLRDGWSRNTTWLHVWMK